MSNHLRTVRRNTLADMKRLVTKGATLAVVKSDTLPVGLVRLVTRTTGRGYYYSWSTPQPTAALASWDRRGYAAWPYARDVEVLNDHTFTVMRNGASVTWSINVPTSHGRSDTQQPCAGGA